MRTRTFSCSDNLLKKKKHRTYNPPFSCFTFQPRLILLWSTGYAPPDGNSLEAPGIRKRRITTEKIQKMKNLACKSLGLTMQTSQKHVTRFFWSVYHHFSLKKQDRGTIGYKIVQTIEGLPSAHVLQVWLNHNITTGETKERIHPRACILGSRCRKWNWSIVNRCK